MARQPAAFMSYVHFDDQHEGGQISEFRERLSAEVRMQTGAEFPIFQDRNDIAWGQNWRTRIQESMDAVTLLIPIITPSFFRSPHCRDEVSRFLERERQLGRGDLVLPVYYISTPEMDDPAVRDTDELAQVLADRQYADWRELRFEPFTSPVVRRALAQLANRLRDSFWRPPLPAGPPDRSASRSTGGPATGTASRVATGSGQPVAKNEPPTHVVDPYHRGDYPTIGEAIEAARPGDRILVRPGLYQESLVIDKPLELLGDGPPADILIQAAGSTVLLFKANIGRVANLTLRQVGGGRWHGVDITQGRLELEGCDISSESLACVAIRNGADPRIRRNHIHDGKQGGVHVYDNGLGLLEDNDIHSNTYSGIEIKTGGNPTLRRNQIHDSKQGGVYVHDNGLGLLEDNDIHSNTRAGVSIKTGGNPTLRRNRINRNGYEAVWVYEGGQGVIEENDLRDNGRGPWDIAQDSKKNVKRARNLER